MRAFLLFLGIEIEGARAAIAVRVEWRSNSPCFNPSFKPATYDEEWVRIDGEWYLSSGEWHRRSLAHRP